MRKSCGQFWHERGYLQKRDFRIFSGKRRGNWRVAPIGWNGNPYEAASGVLQRPTLGRIGWGEAPRQQAGCLFHPFRAGICENSPVYSVMPLQCQLSASSLARPREIHSAKRNTGSVSLRGCLKFLLVFVVFVHFSFAMAARADDCGICGQHINGTIYLMTDAVTGHQVEVCSNCTMLPRCFICQMPVKDGGVHLPDGRWLCARDAQTAVIDADSIQHIFEQVHDYMDHLYVRFTSFPTNVDVSTIDGIDGFQFDGNSFESPDILGVTEPYTTNGVKRYKIGLLTGQPLSQLEETCAHELSHAWVGENVSPERHGRIERDAEEGFCEMMGYLVMDAMGEEGEKKRVLENPYTRGQVELFIAAEQEYGFDEILDWMQHGVTGRLEEGHLDEIRDVQMPVAGSSANQTSVTYASRRIVAPAPRPAPSALQLQGIMWGGMPSAIINGCSFFAGDRQKVPLGRTRVTVQCLSIAKTSVEIRNLDSGEDLRLNLPSNH
jgi:hypothetical protein